jgi:hypothetical protein
MQGREDTAHLLFQCHTAWELWISLGVIDCIDEALLSDRSGSAILEYLLRDLNSTVPGFMNMGLKELIGVYLAGIYGGSVTAGRMGRRYHRSFNVRCRFYPLLPMQRKPFQICREVLIDGRNLRSEKLK